VQVGPEAAQLDRPAEGGLNRAPRGLGGDQDRRLEVLLAAEVAVAAHGHPQVVGQGLTEAGVVPAPLAAVGAAHGRRGRVFGVQPVVGRVRVGGRPGQHPRRLADGDPAALATLTLIQQGVGAVSAQPAPVEPGRGQRLPAERLDRPPGQVREHPLSHRRAGAGRGAQDWGCRRRRRG
jgi:hypothetical protein